jgi:hypothetical protein
MTSLTAPNPEQLTLLPPSSVPVQFRLDEATRRRGLRHIAEIRAQLENAGPTVVRRSSRPTASSSLGPPGRRTDRAA